VEYLNNDVNPMIDGKVVILQPQIPFVYDRLTVRSLLGHFDARG
jgi:hypothetical protein